ncbi:hypothetical protein P8S54_04380 [Thiomicrospira sp. R3]|uniref:hypothetical protein n=1 Tax=Thiomicrospira sp. R3 TaxID=3035472 RepID=UPI00259BDF2F|nr:hypothetical protein [Thiomicrospira sp. R3]WFE69542.1 hypothetical protein P8S54_04380 [Thiomicrospira sp. R3]
MDIWIAALLNSLSTVVLMLILVFLSRTWIEKRIQYSIKHEYDRKLSEIEHSREIRIKAELVADLLAEWINKNEDKQKLNELTFKAFLWLPPELASELSNALSHKDEASNVREIINKVRKHLLGDDDSLKDHEVTVFPVLK